MKVAASKARRSLGVLMIVAACAYMIPFVPRGWMPHDEGMLGQSAERVLRGDLPHVDYEEAYTGGLSWVYALVFKVAGVDLVNVRWLLFAGASVAAWLVYAIVRRFLEPIGAALATWVAVTWSFPNYFAGLPSWWLLVCALACLWALIRHVETRQIRYVVVAALAVGAAMAIKQTGVYLLVALVLSLMYDSGPTHRASWFARLERWVRWGAAASAIVLAAFVLASRIQRAEGLYLFVPAVACAVTLVLPTRRNTVSASARSPLMLTCTAMAVAALPLACLFVPYAVRDQVWDFVFGSVVLPQKRVTFASRPMPDAESIVAGLPLLALVFPMTRWRVDALPMWLRAVLWTAAILLPVLALWNVTSYQFIWQSSRAVAAMLPVGMCWQLASNRVSSEHRPVLFASAAMLAWSSLNQYPFPAPIYFLYVAPLAVVAGVAAAGAGSALSRQTMLPWAVMLLLFAGLSMNRGYIQGLGVAHEVRRFDAALKLPRAHLRVTGGEVCDVSPARVYHPAPSRQRTAGCRSGLP